MKGNKKYNAVSHTYTTLNHNLHHIATTHSPPTPHPFHRHPSHLYMGAVGIDGEAAVLDLFPRTLPVVEVLGEDEVHHTYHIHACAEASLDDRVARVVALAAQAVCHGACLSGEALMNRMKMDELVVLRCRC